MDKQKEIRVLLEWGMEGGKEGWRERGMEGNIE
jgi:hypothetical protein